MFPQNFTCFPPSIVDFNRKDHSLDQNATTSDKIFPTNDPKSKKKSILSRVGVPQRKCFWIWGSATKMFLYMGFRNKNVFGYAVPQEFFQPKGFRVEKKIEKHCYSKTFFLKLLRYKLIKNNYNGFIK
jgi:hypothetical protein